MPQRHSSFCAPLLALLLHALLMYGQHDPLGAAKSPSRRSRSRFWMPHGIPPKEAVGHRAAHKKLQIRALPPCRAKVLSQWHWPWRKRSWPKLTLPTPLAAPSPPSDRACRTLRRQYRARLWHLALGAPEAKWRIGAICTRLTQRRFVAAGYYLSVKCVRLRSILGGLGGYGLPS